MGNAQFTPGLYALDPLQQHIFGLIEPYFQSHGKTPANDITMKALDMAFLIRSIHGAEVDDHPNRVALFDSLAPKAPSSLFSRVVRGPAPTRTLALVIVQFGRDGLGYKKLVEIDYYDSSSRYEIIKAMVEDVQAKIKTVLEDKDGPEKAVPEKQGTLQTTAVVPADVLTGALAENASVALTGQASEGTKRKRDASPSSGREDREAKKRKSAVDQAKKFGPQFAARPRSTMFLTSSYFPTSPEPSPAVVRKAIPKSRGT